MEDNKYFSYTKNSILNKSNDQNILVNYSCLCSKSLCIGGKLLYILPCCHIIHENCFNDYILKYQYKKLFTNNKNNFSTPSQQQLTNTNEINHIDKSFKDHMKCPFCKNNITTVLTEYKIYSKKKYHQYKIDMKSIKIDNSASINYMILPLSAVKFTSLMNKLIIANTEKDLLNTVEYIFSSFNIKINIIDNTKNNPIVIKNNKITWKNKKDNENKLVIISNHSHYLDSVIIYYLFRCGFVSSDFINQTDIGKIIATKLKLLIFKRGVDTNMVEKIKEYLNEQKKIAIFPEGAFANNETLIRFRTGAFYVGETICPVVIKYDKVIYDDDFKQMLFKLITQNEIVVNIYINDFFYPPFNEEKIESVRDLMANVGKFEKSRVSNKSIRE
jgi:1-acyl-sn-glycerol-3-phosphate acyltransferase